MRALLLGTMIFSLFIFSCGSSEKEELYTGLNDADLMDLAGKYYAAKQYDKAMETYDYVKKNFPDTDYFVEINIGKARVLGKLERYEDELELIYKTLKANIMPQKVPRIYVEIGNFYQKFAAFDPGISGTGGEEDDYRLAIDNYQKALKYDESNDTNAKSEALANIGLVYAKQKQYPKATQIYQEFIKEYPESPYYISVSQRLNKVQDTSPFQIIYPEDVADQEKEDEEVVDDKSAEEEVQSDENKQSDQSEEKMKETTLAPDSTVDQPQQNN